MQAGKLPCIEAQVFCQYLSNGQALHMLDVREQWEFEEFHFSNGRHIPLPELLFRLNELEDWRHQEFVVYCRSGIRGQQAQKLLMACGFQKVKNLVGGIDAVLGYLEQKQ